MEFLTTLLTPSKSPKEYKLKKMVKQDNTIKGNASTISKYIYNDIQHVKQEIKSYNELTKVFVHNKLYYKLYKFMEQSQANELANLKQKYHYNNSNEYFKELVQLYKSFLSDYEGFLKIIQYNYNNSILKESRSQSEPSRQSITSSLDSINKDDDIPEDLIDPLSYELFHDPVITPSGITYEKSIILDHLDRNGKFDPLTKQPLNPDQLYPNLAIKNSVCSYIEQKSS